MKKLFPFMALLLAAGTVWAEHQCIPNQTAIIQSESSCDKSGISIGLGEEDGAQVACMQSQVVQNRCGPDGSLTRLHAYETWQKNLDQFQHRCEKAGGTFSYDDPNFVEPTNDSYCEQAVPEVASNNMFEEPLCNFHSACPAVTVRCEMDCSAHSVASRF